jgi:hypothetical protein
MYARRTNYPAPHVSIREGGQNRPQMWVEELRRSVYQLPWLCCLRPVPSGPVAALCNEPLVFPKSISFFHPQLDRSHHCQSLTLHQISHRNQKEWNS